MNDLDHPITKQSFTLIDQEIGHHSLSQAEYAIVRRVIHATADFEFLDLLVFSPGAISAAQKALSQGVPIITDVAMVKQGIQTLVNKTYQNPVIAAIDVAPIAAPNQTRSQTGMIACWQDYPQAIYVIGNAPTALLALCQEIKLAPPQQQPSLVIGVPVGFVQVLEAKEALAQTRVPQIRVEGRKGGSAVAAAIVNALIVLAWQS